MKDDYDDNRAFSPDVTAAMLVSLNKGTASILVSPTIPPGIELYSYANLSFLFWLKNMLFDHMSENTLDRNFPCI